MSVASQFAALPMESLIGGPLNAAATAQGTLASITTQFITDVGLQADSKGNLSARTVDFKYDKPFKIAAVAHVPFKAGTPAVAEVLNADGSVKTPGSAEIPEVTEVKKVDFKAESWSKVSMNLVVPLLTIVKAPNLQIKEVNVTFDMAVSTSDSSANTNSQSATVSASYRGWGAKVKFSGTVSNKNESQRKSDTSAKYHVDVKALDEGAPEGLMKVLDILGEAIQPAV
jgi:hypothetical protein